MNLNINYLKKKNKQQSRKVDVEFMGFVNNIISNRFDNKKYFPIEVTAYTDSKEVEVRTSFYDKEFSSKVCYLFDMNIDSYMCKYGISNSLL